jgi:hypothetical protein
VRVAKILRHHFQTSEDEAVAEATNIAVTDGLYSEHPPLISFLEPQAAVRLNLGGTFARAGKVDLDSKYGMHRILFLS